ncbi:hypothetical protein V5N11_017318 [Cardamine amara subsp. amara]|uniref:Uncharacterized protein n=1 Tax=Cardamine amara subsp. amara TaxID=228776 RepID=A0ABD1AD50_CARAN
MRIPYFHMMLHEFFYRDNRRFLWLIILPGNFRVKNDWILNLSRLIYRFRGRRNRQTLHRLLRLVVTGDSLCFREVSLLRLQEPLAADPLPAEFCGGTTASCAAVWCCCPCGLVNLLVLAVYKVPRGICRRALRNRHRKRLVKNGILPPLPAGGKNERMQRIFQNSEFAIHPLDSNDVSDDDDDSFLDLKYIGKSTAAELTTDEETDEEDEAVLALEKEMWNRFYGAGFWRSPSQRESVSSPKVSKSLSSSPRPSITESFRNMAIRGGGGGGGATVVVAATSRAVRH